MEKKKYPIRAEDYELFELIGDGGSATVHRARCIIFDEIVAVKILDFEKNSDLTTVSREAQTMILIDHPNVLKAHCSFVKDHNLWVVMPFMAGGSCLHIMKSAYPNGFEEVIIATLLKEVLKGIEYLHQHGHMHRDIKAGNILVDGRGGVKIGDFGVSACLFDSGDRSRKRNTFVGTPCWMAPEVMDSRNGYDFKADIWSFGITALELAHGHAPFSSQPPVKITDKSVREFVAGIHSGVSNFVQVLRQRQETSQHVGESQQVFLMTLQNAPPSLESSKDKKFSKSFKHMIATCLVKDPTKRPTAHKLLKMSFFKQARSQDYIARKILEGLPSLTDRFQALKLKEAELVAQKKMLEWEKEAMSQVEYKRGISSWNFDIDDLKAQASLIPDDDNGSHLPELGALPENVPQGTGSSTMNASSLENIVMHSRIDSHSSSDQPDKFQRNRSDVSEDDYKASSSGDLNGSEKSGQAHGNDKNHSIPNRQECVKKQCQEQKKENCSKSHAATDISSEAVPKMLKSTASLSDDNDDKLKATSVQQKGRFKVTSENVDFDKAHSTPTQPLSPSAQDGREKKLVVEIAELQRRLALSEEELQRIRANKAQKNTEPKSDHGAVELASSS